MRFKWLCILLTVVLFPHQSATAGMPELQIRVTKPGAIVTVDRNIGDDKVLLSVADASKKPFFGLGSNDFAMTKGERAARVVSVQPIAESLDVPRHFVLMLDNSDSMRQRNAVAPLLAGVDELLKIVRPIDQVQIVVFANKQTVNVGGRDLHVQTFSSNNPIDLKNFVANIYRDGVTSTTVLYEGMLAGLDLIRKMPAGEPRFLVVFSDGEDINSAYKREDVLKAAEGLEKFDAYAIDYMPGPVTDKFLAAFADQNHGQIWKATSETNLVSIFQSVASKMQYYYVVTYLFPPQGSLKASPASLTVDELKAVDASPAVGSAVDVAPGITSLVRSIDASALTLRPTVDSVYGVARWKISVSNGSGTLGELSGSGDPAAETVMPFKTDDLGALVAGGDLKITMEVQDRKGQNLLLSAPPVKVTLLSTTGSLAVNPVSLTIEEVKTIDASPMLGHIYFSEGSSEIPAQYVRVAGSEEITGFDEQRFRDTLEKYYQVLNIVGKRLNDHPETTITLVGCNANTGVEKGQKKLSTQRAEAVRDYLQTVWGIAPERIAIEVRNLPEMPSTSRKEEGRADNRRVEVRSDHPAILDLVRSTYFATRIDVPALTLSAAVDSARGIAQWQAVVANASGNVAVFAAEGAPPPKVTVPLPTGKLNDLAAGGDLVIRMELLDRKGQKLTLFGHPVKVNFLQTSQRLAQKQDFLVQEKYALILFDFDSDAIDARNQEIVNAIVARIKELPQAKVEIVGHTDNLGKEAYNIKLSERRALAVYKLMSAAYGEAPDERIRHSGAGPNAPLYENISSEARAFNRTVTITLEYLATE